MTYIDNSEQHLSYKFGETEWSSSEYIGNQNTNNAVCGLWLWDNVHGFP